MSDVRRRYLLVSMHPTTTEDDCGGCTWRSDREGRQWCSVFAVELDDPHTFRPTDAWSGNRSPDVGIGSRRADACLEAEEAGQE